MEYYSNLDATSEPAWTITPEPVINGLARAGCWELVREEIIPGQEDAQFTVIALFPEPALPRAIVEKMNLTAEDGVTYFVCQPTKE